MRYLSVLILAVLLWGCPPPCSGLAQETEIMTTGVGAVAVQPDYASAVVWIRVTEKTATESTREAAAIYQRLVRQVEAVGVAPSDVMTKQFSVGQDWKRDENGRPKELIGYVTAHKLKIRVGDRERVGEVIDAAIAAGARSIDKIEFASAKADSAQRVALGEAVRDARERAEIMAEAAGGRLGPLVEVMTEDAVRARGGTLRIDETRYGMVSLMSAEPLQTSLAPGALTQSAVVLARWQLITGE